MASTICLAFNDFELYSSFVTLINILPWYWYQMDNFHSYQNIKNRNSEKFNEHTDFGLLFYNEYYDEYYMI